MQGHVIREYSQERKVQEALHRVGISHNAGVVAHLANVRVSPGGTVYFCSSKLTVASELTPGDGGLLPDRVTLEGRWEFAGPGYYDLHNARIAINGAISIIREEETELVPVRQPDPRWEFSPGVTAQPSVVGLDWPVGNHRVPTWQSREGL
jgi:hypothetical protein